MSAAGPHRLRWTWAAAAALMLAEFLLFDRMTSRHHAAFYPRWNDQIQYLSEAYNAWEHARAGGLLAGVKAALAKNALQGSVHDVAALVVFELAGGASRSAALSLNMLVFLAWQAGLLAVIPRVTGSRALGWMAFGLLPCLAWPWSGEAGSAVDFRLDHGAMCLMGLTATVALLTDGFRSARWSLLFGAVMGLTLLERFLTGVYFAGIMVACGGWVLLASDRAIRLRHLLLSAAVTTALALPVFWANRTAIYNYYWVGHVAGAEGDARYRGLDLAQSVRFVFRNLATMHLGPWFAATAAVVTVILVAAALRARRAAPDPAAGRGWLFFAVIFTLMPAAALSLHRQKSEYVLGALVPGVVLLVLWVWARAWARVDFTRDRFQRWLAPALAAGVVLAGGKFFVDRQRWEPHDADFLASAREVNEIADHIYKAAHLAKLANPVIGVDQVVDFVDAQILGVVCYERNKVWYSFVTQLPNSILAEPDDVTFYKLNLCDFILLTDYMEGDGYWPYDKQMRRLYPELKDWCDEHRRLAKTMRVFGRDMSLYQRREYP